MANNVEWAYVDSASAPTLLGPYDEAGDNNCPAEEEESSTLHGIAIGDVVIYGEPVPLRSFLLRCVAALDPIIDKKD